MWDQGRISSQVARATLLASKVIGSINPSVASNSTFCRDIPNLLRLLLNEDTEQAYTKLGILPFYLWQIFSLGWHTLRRRTGMHALYGSMIRCMQDNRNQERSSYLWTMVSGNHPSQTTAYSHTGIAWLDGYVITSYHTLPAPYLSNWCIMMQIEIEI